jgi:hypothetical protein
MLGFMPLALAFFAGCRFTKALFMPCCGTKMPIVRCIVQNIYENQYPKMYPAAAFGALCIEISAVMPKWSTHFVENTSKFVDSINFPGFLQNVIRI